MLLTEFTNEEIICLYQSVKNKLDDYEKQFEQKVTSYFSNNVLQLFILTESDVEFIKNTQDYKSAVDIINKLKPIYEILSEHPEYQNHIKEYG